MYPITTPGATSMTMRVRLADLCSASAADVLTQGCRIAGAVFGGNGAAVPSYIPSVTGIQAWSPPV